MSPRVAKARLENPAIDELCAWIEARAKLSFVDTDNDFSGNLYENGEMLVELGKAKHVAATLYHELLHAEIKLNGYVQQAHLLRTAPCEGLEAVVYAVDNELQHHRMFPKFEAAGFASSHFYADSDVNSYELVKKEAKKLERQKSTSPWEYLLPYLATLAPGGHGDERARSQAKTFLESRAPHDILIKLKAVEVVISKWRDHNQLNSDVFIKAVLEILGYSDCWVGRSGDFPGDGFFIGTPFTYERALAYHAARPR